ncbi:winged helix-turn-helix domain-containing protein [Erythrobacter sp.]|uniref:winged helix-turn-helix domain-containing protein n=1 Tax=Erythrobacter sp. TaxID=1042 RepID=UPI0032EE95DD
MKAHARPLEDTPEDIVSRALDALEGRTPEQRKQKNVGRPRSSQRGKKLPQKAFREPLLLALSELGGAASLDEVRRVLEPMVASKLQSADKEPVSNGDPRWWNAACWERSEMVKDGLLQSNSPRGRWELSEIGQLEANALSSR